MNEAAYWAIEEAWTVTVKARALSPYVDASAVGATGYASPGWYRTRDARFVVSFDHPLTSNDIIELNNVGGHINRSFVIWMAAILEAHGVVPYHADPDRSKPGGDYAQLTKWLRNRFAHGEWEYDPTDCYHAETRELLGRLFPVAAKTGLGYVLNIDQVLEPLKDGVLEYVRQA